MKYSLIENQSDLDKVIEEIYSSNCKEIAVDLEGESNLHRYGFHLCLIQIKTCIDCYLIDPLAIDDLSGVKRIFEDESIQKMMYAAEFDVKLLFFTHKIELKGLFDLQMAAKLLGLEKLSLKNALETFIDIQVPKSKKKQQSNWSLRPLRLSLLEYAAADVYFLFDLKNRMLPELENNGFMKNLIKTNKSIENVRFAEVKHPHLSIKRSQKLNRRATVYLKHFYELREHIAKENDVPVFKVIRNNDLAKIAKYPPVDESKWLELNELTSLAKNRIGDFLLSKEAADREVKSLNVK
ncbi:MAG: ribonuclease D [Melioribacteraceae bacterium]|nr:ribonuclease D [Melioribacteraceae bacterium]